MWPCGEGLGCQRLLDMFQRPLDGPLAQYKAQRRPEYEECRRRLKTPRPAHAALDDFVPISRLGSGSFGQVFLVTHKATAYDYAMKVCRKPGGARHETEQLYMERRILFACNHNFITKLIYTFAHGPSLFFIMEYAPCGTLKSIAERYSPLRASVVRLMAAQLVMALEYLHEVKIAHRDLNPNNVLVFMRCHLKLTDFGLAADVSRGDVQGFCGTVNYIAPEVHMRARYNVHVDWFSLGCILADLIGYDRQSASANRATSPVALQALFQRAQTKIIGLMHNTDRLAQSFISRLLEADYRKRLGYSNGSIAVMMHRWFNDIDWVAMYNGNFTIDLVIPVLEKHLNTENLSLLPTDYDERLNEQLVDF